MITWFQKRALSPLPAFFIKANLYLGSNPNLPLFADGGEVGGGALFDCPLIKWKLNTFLLELPQSLSERAHPKDPILPPVRSLPAPSESTRTSCSG